MVGNSHYSRRRPRSNPGDNHGGYSPKRFINLLSMAIARANYFRATSWLHVLVSTTMWENPETSLFATLFCCSWQLQGHENRGLNQDDASKKSTNNEWCVTWEKVTTYFVASFEQWLLMLVCCRAVLGRLFSGFGSGSLISGSNR